jgi:heme A synthase
VQQVVSRLRRSKLFWSAVVVLLLAVAAVKVALHFWLIPASYADARLKRDAEKVPVPAGLVSTGYSHQSYDGLPVSQQEADLSYDNPSMSCDQLHTAWLAVLAKHHLRVDTPDSTALQIFIRGLGADVAVTLGEVGDCSRPSVGAQDN